MNQILDLIEAIGPLVQEGALRGLCLFVLAFIAARLLGRRSAAIRHLIWTASILAALVLPGLIWVLPAWRVLDASPLDNPYRGVPRNDARSIDAGVGPPPAAEPSSTKSEASDLATTFVQPADLPAGLESDGRPNRATVISLLWLTGALTAFAPILIGWWRLVRLRRRCVRCDDLEWLDLLEASKNLLGIQAPVTLLLGSPASMPATMGVIHPVIFIPPEALNWPAPRRRIVLLHELAHVRRHDWLTQVLASLACAVHWFNPLAWWSAKETRRAQEEACDDLVLVCGVSASNYAEELLEFASGFRRADPPACICVPMARQSSLENRLLAILDSSRERHQPGHGMIPATLILTMVVTATVAVVDGREKRPTGQPLNLSSGPRLRPVFSLVIPSEAKEKRFWSLSDRRWHTSRPKDEPFTHLERDPQSGWQLVVENAYNYRLDKERGGKAWESMSAAEIAQPAGLAAVPFERTGIYPLGHDDLPITILVPTIGLMQIVEPIEGDSFAVLLRCKLVSDEIPSSGTVPDAGRRPDAGNPLSEARTVVRQWLEHVGNNQIDLVWPLTTRSSEAAPSVDLQQTWEFKKIAPAWSLGNDRAAMVVSNRYNDNAGRQRALVFALERKDGTWLIREQFGESPENVYRHAAGFAAHPGIRYDVPAESIVGRWKHLGFLGVFESTFLLRADGSGAIVESTRGRKTGEKPLRWKVSRGELSWTSDSEMTAGIIRFEHDFFALKLGNGQMGYHRETEPDSSRGPAQKRPKEPEDPPVNPDKGP